LFLSSGISSQEGGNQYISLRECIDRALRDNLNLKAYHLGLRSSVLSIVQAESRFDPELSLDMTRNESETATFYDYYKVNSVSSKQSNLNFTIGQLLPTGADWGVGFYNTLSESNIEIEKNYTSNFGIQFNQPILKGFGRKVNRSNIYLARISSESAGYDLENRSTDLVYEVLNAYWNLVYARETMKVREISRAQADSLLAYNQKGFELGIMTESEVLEAKSALVARQQEVLDQKNVIRTAEDVLRRLLNMTSEQEWTLNLVPDDKPVMESVELVDEKALSEALTSRPDYKIAQKTLAQNELYIAVSKNSKLPSLNLTGRYRLNGSGKTVSKDLRDLGDTDEYGWSLGLLLSYPLRNRYAKAEFEKKQVDFKRAELALEDMKSQIFAEIRSSIRNVTISRERIDVARLSVEVNELKLKKEEERYRNNLSTSYYVLEFQRDLADSRNIYNKVLLDYMLAVAEFQKARGKLLNHLDISIITEDK
jgi:outer membrane protein TolC